MRHTYRRHSHSNQGNRLPRTREQSPPVRHVYAVREQSHHTYSSSSTARTSPKRNHAVLVRSFESHPPSRRTSVRWLDTAARRIASKIEECSRVCVLACRDPHSSHVAVPGTLPTARASSI